MSKGETATRRRPSKKALVRVALEQCAAGFVIKPAEQQDIDWEGMAREFYRRMVVAKEALQHVR